MEADLEAKRKPATKEWDGKYYRYCRVHLDESRNDLWYRTDDITLKVGDYVILRHLSIASKELGLYGITDAVELHPSTTAENAIQHPKYPGYWKPFPIEYKHGHAKPDERDVVQLVAQAMCLEEMLCCDIQQGALYFGEIKRRVLVDLSSELREEVRKMLLEMLVRRI